MSNSNGNIRYALEPKLDPGEFVAVLEASGLSARRPVGDAARVERMLAEATLLVTARVGDRLVGVARSLTDFSFCIYLSDLAVDRAWQGHGIGRRLIERSHWQAGAEVTDLILLAAPEAETYYPRVGLRRFPQCFLIRRQR